MYVHIDDDVTEGDDVTVTCDTSGGNPPEVEGYYWKLEKKYEDLKVDFKCSQNECVIPDVHRAHSGVYTCSTPNWDGYYNTSNTEMMTVKCECLYIV